MRGSVTDGDTPSILERDLRGTFLNTGAGNESRFTTRDSTKIADCESDLELAA
jgi:hypothetical protein